MKFASKTTYDFDVIIVVANPASKNASVANQRIARLESLYPHKVHLIEAREDIIDTRAVLLASLADVFTSGKRPVLAIAGGDGTVNAILQTLTGPTVPPFVCTIPIVPLGAGNANDLAWMLYDNPGDIEHIFAAGRPLHISPLQCTITPPHGLPERHMAANYMSFGATAHGAYELNKPEVRKHSRLKAWYGKVVPDFLAIRAALQAPTFRVTIQGKERCLRDLLIGNGDRIAKVGKMPVRLDRAEMYITAVEQNWLGRNAITIGAVKLALGVLPGRVLKGDSYVFKTIDAVAAQFDGEPLLIPPNSKVRIQSAPVAICALTTKPPTHGSSKHEA